MADNVNLPPSGTGDTGVRASTQKVTADSSDVQDVALASVVSGVRTRVSPANPLPVSLGTANQNVVPTATITWGASAAAGTAGSATVTIPAQDGTATKLDKPLMVLVRNMSTGAVTIDMRVQISWNDGSARFALIGSIAVPAGATASGDDGGTAFLIDKANLAGGGRLAFVNVTAGPVGGLSITVQVWQ